MNEEPDTRELIVNELSKSLIPLSVTELDKRIKSVRQTISNQAQHLKDLGQIHYHSLLHFQPSLTI